MFWAWAGRIVEDRAWVEDNGQAGILRQANESGTGICNGKHSGEVIWKRRINTGYEDTIRGR